MKRRIHTSRITTGRYKTMDEKDKIIQSLKRENEALREFQRWLAEEAFGEDQFKILLAEFFKDHKFS